MNGGGGGEWWRRQRGRVGTSKGSTHGGNPRGNPRGDPGGGGSGSGSRSDSGSDSWSDHGSRQGTVPCTTQITCVSMALFWAASGHPKDTRQPRDGGGRGPPWQRPQGGRQGCDPCSTLARGRGVTNVLVLFLLPKGIHSSHGRF